MADGDGGNITRATFLDFFDELVDAKAVVDSASGKYRNVLKRAKGAGLNEGELKSAMRLSNQDRDAREKNHRDLMQYMVWLDKTLGPVGTQGALGLDDPQPASPEDAAAAEKHGLTEAHREGVAAGKMGANIASCPHDVGTEPHQQWVSGWHVGQTEIAGEMAPTPRGRRRAPAPQAEGAEA